MIQYEEIRHFGPENFVDLVECQSTGQKSSSRKDRFDRTIERIVFYRGSVILGMKIHDVTGYRYYIRK